MVFHLVFHWVSRFIHLTQMEVIYWLLTASIINKFENVIHKEEKAMLEHTIRLHTRKTIYLNLSLITYIYYVLSPCTVYIKLSNFILFSLENDDMESSKRCAKLLSLTFIIRCLTKSTFTITCKTTELQ